MRRTLAALVVLALGVMPGFAAEPPLPVKKPKDFAGRPVVGLPTTALPATAPAVTGPAAQTPPSGTNTAAPKPGETTGKSESKPSPPQFAPSWPKTVPEAKAEAAAKANPASVPTEWPKEEVDSARALCKVILDKIDAVTLPEPAFREGACGNPAPVRLISLGRNPEVVLSPPAVISCGMVGALHTWLTRDLQPLAKKTLGSELIKIETMSDYSCRNAYGRTKTKLSEHGRANALDIRGFVTARGELAYVLTGWGTPDREIIARALAARKAEEHAAAVRAAAEKAAADRAAAADRSGKGPALKSVETAAGSPRPTVRPTIADGAGGAAPASSSPALGLAPPSHLGGPKETDEGERSPRMRTFLRQAHAAACKIFGTTLGPEANNAHRNHFHVDMAPRSRSNFCE